MNHVFAAAGRATPVRNHSPRLTCSVVKSFTPLGNATLVCSREGRFSTPVPGTELREHARAFPLGRGASVAAHHPASRSLPGSAGVALVGPRRNSVGGGRKVPPVP